MHPGVKESNKYLPFFTFHIHDRLLPHIQWHYALGRSYPCPIIKVVFHSTVCELRGLNRSTGYVSAAEFIDSEAHLIQL